MLESALSVPTIAVSDLGRAKKFYEESLGLKPINETPGGIMYQAGGGTRLFVYPSEFAGTAKSTYMSFEVDDVEATVKELRERGVVFEEYDLPGMKTVDGIADMEGEKAAWFKDLDGNILAVSRQA